MTGEKGGRMLVDGLIGKRVRLRSGREPGCADLRRGETYTALPSGQPCCVILQLSDGSLLGGGNVMYPPNFLELVEE